MGSISDLIRALSKKFTLSGGMILLILFFVFRQPASAEEALKKEIDHLLSFVSAMDCRFERNGKTYDGKKACDHIKKKYAHFKDRISTTEEFIKYCAAESTVSGRRYHVICNGSDPVESETWLSEELKSFRHLSGRTSAKN